MIHSLKTLKVLEYLNLILHKEKSETDIEIDIESEWIEKKLSLYTLYNPNYQYYVLTVLQ